MVQEIMLLRESVHATAHDAEIHNKRTFHQTVIFPLKRLVGILIIQVKALSCLPYAAGPTRKQSTKMHVPTCAGMKTSVKSAAQNFTDRCTERHQHNGTAGGIYYSVF